MLIERNRLVAGAALLTAMLLSGCSTTPYFDAHFGGSVRANLAAQVIDPAAAANTNPVSGVDGKSAVAARERYQRSFKEPDSKPLQLLIGGSGAK